MHLQRVNRWPQVDSFTSQEHLVWSGAAGPRKCLLGTAVPTTETNLPQRYSISSSSSGTAIATSSNSRHSLQEVTRNAFGKLVRKKKQSVLSKIEKRGILIPRKAKRILFGVLVYLILVITCN